jgi:hypothetical protein
MTLFSDRGLYLWLLTAGAMALAGSIWMPGGSTAGTNEQIPLPLRQWTALAMPEVGKGPSGGIKHITAAVNPTNGRIYMTGGDFVGSHFEQSYRQETWSLSLLERWAGETARNAGWQIEYPYCGPSDGVQPKHPDFTGWAWDGKRSVFWMVPGVMEISKENCEGETEARTDDPRFLTYHLMTFDPATRRWADKGRNIGPDVSETWMSLYDPVRDEIIRFGFNGGTGAVVNILRIGNMAWRQMGLPPNAMGKDIRINKEYLAADHAHRVIYAVDGMWGRLHRFSMDSRRMEDLGSAPGGPIGIENYTLLVWDSANEVLLYFRDVPPAGFYAYQPATKRWETLDLASSAPDARLGGRVMVYDAGQNVTMLFGGVEPVNPHMFLYRYGEGGQARPEKK